MEYQPGSAYKSFKNKDAGTSPFAGGSLETRNGSLSTGLWSARSATTSLERYKRYRGDKSRMNAIS